MQDISSWNHTRSSVVPPCCIAEPVHRQNLDLEHHYQYRYVMRRHIIFVVQAIIIAMVMVMAMVK